MQYKHLHQFLIFPVPKKDTTTTNPKNTPTNKQKTQTKPEFTKNQTETNRWEKQKKNTSYVGLRVVWWLLWALSFFIAYESQESAITHGTQKTGLLKRAGITALAARAQGLHVAASCVCGCLLCMPFTAGKAELFLSQTYRQFLWFFPLPSLRKIECLLFWLTVPYKFSLSHETKSICLGVWLQKWLQHTWICQHEFQSGQYKQIKTTQRGVLGKPLMHLFSRSQTWWYKWHKINATILSLLLLLKLFSLA